MCVVRDGVTLEIPLPRATYCSLHRETWYFRGCGRVMRYTEPHRRSCLTKDKKDEHVFVFELRAPAARLASACLNLLS